MTIFSQDLWNDGPFTNIDRDSGNDWEIVIDVSGVFRWAEVNVQPSLASDWIVASGWGFDIPAMATVTSMVVLVKKCSLLYNGIMDDEVYPFISGAPIYSGIENHALGGYWPQCPVSGTVAYTEYGSPTDWWGGQLTPAIINDPTFGIGISCKFGDIYGTSSDAAVYPDWKIELTYNVHGISYGTTGMKRAYFGTTEIKNIYQGNIDLGIIELP